MEFLGFLATPLGYLMQILYNLVLNYGWALMIFTILVRIVMFPVQLRQQKSTARNSAYQPMIQEIQKKWANDRNRMNEEVMKFQQENGMKMTAGCGSMVLNMVIIFSVIMVIYRPLTYILHVPGETVNAAVELIGLNLSDYTAQSRVIGEVMAGNSQIIGVLGTEWATAIQNFNFVWLGLNLAQTPTFSFDALPYLILPVLSLATMFLANFITMRTSGQQQGRGTMIAMTLVMGVLFGTYAFRVPVAFSLYYTVSNVLMLVQSMILKRIYDPEKIKAEVLEEIEERKRQKKAKKVVKVQDETGNTVVKEMNDADLAKLRLARARELDAQRYAGEEADKEAARLAEKVRKIDEEKYGVNVEEKSDKNSENEQQNEHKDLNSEPDDIAIAETGEDAGEPTTVGGTDGAQEKNGDEPAQKQEYKPGRRKRAKQKKAESWAEEEKQSEGTFDTE